MRSVLWVEVLGADANGGGGGAANVVVVAVVVVVLTELVLCVVPWLWWQAP